MLMPRLSESMRDGVIVGWLRESGDQVRPGDDLVEIETDKATVTYQAELAGRLEILAGAGETRAVGAPIARIEAATADVRLKSSPLARRLARDKNIDLAAINGTGPGGRIVRADVEAATPSASAEQDARGAVTVVEPTTGQRTVAARMVEAKRTIPEFTVTTEIGMDACAELRDRIATVTGEAPTYNAMVVKAVALALRAHPRVNAAYLDDTFHLYGRVNVGIAVAAEDALLVPTVFDADTRTLTDIDRAAHTLAQRARTGLLTPAELDGGTFTVSNLGMYGVSEFTAVINPPQAAILAVGAVEERACARDGVLAVGRVLRATLTADHRILNGADAAAFLARVRELLTEPLALLLGGRSDP
ncbi:2-oxo acid dehydrogenase subunit E2 [Saccharopolyspora sp. K220]|uniref:dihydrolipoamide acetyltransferase family protein n=1 Tax=Saccharopolyspora soli TaxID=2926618 RepID=UPI001F58CF46|nr:dihydrolipoamide acetyltransferase family protein [Saccharopolyspora soli]MCI2415936.1 2-oxo acid dehydrogenase subunit E2 [Saccharopolyspora soli]